MTTPRGSVLRSIQILDDATEEKIVGAICEPCSIDNKKRNAFRFCQQCQKNLCRSCVEEHAQSQTTNQHRLISKMESGPRKASKIVDTCKVHPGKLVDMYCGDHDEFCCSICVAVHHRNCNDVSYVPEKSRDVSKSDEYLNLRKQFRNLKKIFEQVKLNREKHLKNITRYEDEIISQVNEVQRRLIEIMNKIASRTLAEVERFYRSEKSVAVQSIRICDEVIPLIDAVEDKFNTIFKTGNDPLLFVEMKKAPKTYTKYAIAADMVLQRKPRRVVFEKNRSLEDDLLGNRAFGKLARRDIPEFPGRMFSARLRSDDRVCDVRGATFLPGGRIVLADYNNRKLKLVNTSYSCSPLCTFMSGPASLSRVTPTEVVASLPDEGKIAVVNVMSGDVIYKRFKDVKMVTCSNRKIYVIEAAYCLDPGGRLSTGLRVNEITRRSLQGKEMSSWDISGAHVAPSFFPCPTGAVVSPADGTLHVVDAREGLFSVKKVGNRLQATTFRDKDMEVPFGIDQNIHGELFVTGRGSNNVMRLDRSRKRLHVLLSEEDGLKRPQAVSVDDENLRILVSQQDSNTVMIFSLDFDPYGHFWEKDILYGVPKRGAIHSNK